MGSVGIAVLSCVVGTAAGWDGTVEQAEATVIAAASPAASVPARILRSVVSRSVIGAS
ncbi:hypothetical protein GCM10028864_66980 [Microlunatus parietis]